MFSCNKSAMKSQQMKLFETNGNFQLLIRLICKLILPIPHRLAHNTGHSPTHFTHWSQINIFRILEIRNCNKKKINTLPVLSITDHCRTRTNKMSNNFFFYSKQSRHLILTRINNQKQKPFIFMIKHYLPVQSIKNPLKNLLYSSYVPIFPALTTSLHIFVKQVSLT